MEKLLETYKRYAREHYEMARVYREKGQHHKAANAAAIGSVWDMAGNMLQIAMAQGSK